jgi:NAD(P)-dependent dehydrogenase (short-subunit alcohol dehydrogenase family)
MDKGTVIVTGGASGIGFAAARRLHEGGWRVALLDRDQSALSRAVGEIGSASTSTHVVDVTDEAAVAQVVAEAAAAGPIRGLVNSAGIAADVPLAETSVALFRKILDVNVIGSFLLVRNVVPLMEAAGGGSIVNIASVSGLKGNIGRTAYGASKGAVVTMTKVMAVELAASGIRVNAVAPGPVDTPMVQSLHTSVERDVWLRHVPLRRYASPDEIAGGIAYLLDESLSSFVTGHVLAIDGGFVAGGTIRPM